MEEGTQPAAAPVDGRRQPPKRRPMASIRSTGTASPPPRSGYSAMGQAADYTRKTQEIAQQRQQLQQQAEALATVLPAHPAGTRQASASSCRGAALPDPRMIDTDPQGYLRQFAAYQAATAEQQRLGTLTPAAAAGLRAARCRSRSRPATKC